MDTKTFTSFLHSNIPLTEFMDIQAETYTPEKVVLSVPFAQNKNDKNTGFAGSISALMTVCGWSVMYANFHELLPKGNIVAQKTQLRYIAPPAIFEQNASAMIRKANRLCWILSQKEEKAN